MALDDLHGIFKALKDHVIAWLIETIGADRFDARITPHSHFICRNCGCVMDVMVPLNDPVPQVNQSWGHGEVEECRMEFYGICEQCKQSAKCS